MAYWATNGKGVEPRKCGADSMYASQVAHYQQGAGVDVDNEGCQCNAGTNTANDTAATLDASTVWYGMESA